MAPRPQPSPGRTYQQLRLKTLSRTEKVGFMARVLRGTDGGGEADGAHKCPAGSRAAQSHEREPGWGGRLPRNRDNRPSANPERRSAANPGRAARDRRQSPEGSRVDRPLQVLRSLGGFRATRPTGASLGPGPASPATGSKLMRGPAPASRPGPAPCGPWGRSHAVAVATGSVCAPGCGLTLPWPLRSGSRAGRSPRLAPRSRRRSRRCG